MISNPKQIKAEHSMSEKAFLVSLASVPFTKDFNEDVTEEEMSEVLCDLFSKGFFKGQIRIMESPADAYR